MHYSRCSIPKSLCTICIPIRGLLSYYFLSNTLIRVFRHLKILLNVLIIVYHYYVYDANLNEYHYYVYDANDCILLCYDSVTCITSGSLLADLQLSEIALVPIVKLHQIRSQVMSSCLHPHPSPSLLHAITVREKIRHHRKISK